ncbi:MAG: phenylalanine 4-monooxygenase [Agriterribacter sp.]
MKKAIVMLQQNYSDYTQADHETWSILYKRQLEKIQRVAYDRFEPGLQQLDFQADRIPRFTQVNEKLKAITGWTIYAVPGLIDNSVFFERMRLKGFGATTWIRKREQLDYLEEPDMFHDVFGHVPLLTDPLVCDFLHGLAMIAADHREDAAVIETLARLYWYTVEFGLVRQNGQLKIYGAGILSSIGETGYALSDAANRVPFSIEQMITKPVIKDQYQDTYFVLDDMSQLPASLKEINIKLAQSDVL